jgi:hypothetical protein
MKATVEAISTRDDADKGAAGPVPIKTARAQAGWAGCA